MLKISIVAFTLVASTAASVIQSDALSKVNPSTGAANAAQAGNVASAPAHPIRQAYYQNPKCRWAERQIAVYSRALSRLQTVGDAHRRMAPVYREARQAEKDWHDHNCR